MVLCTKLYYMLKEATMQVGCLAVYLYQALAEPGLHHSIEIVFHQDANTHISLAHLQ